MMIGFIRRRFAVQQGDQGFAMLMALLTVLILTTLTAGVLTETLSAIPQARHETGYQAAMGAAEAGVDDFIDRLDQNYNYATSPDNNAALTGFVPISPGSSESYHYTVDTSQITQVAGTNYGTVTLTSSGKAGNVERTVKVALRPVGFLDSLSTTNYNIVDPALDQPNGWSIAQTQANCEWHAYDSRPANSTYGVAAGTGPTSGCSSMLNYWITGNELNGPMHSNDDFYLCGTPKFDAAVTSGDPNTGDAPYWKDPAGCAGDNPSFAQGSIVGDQTITFPPADSGIESYAAYHTSTGCLYTGPTSITLNGSTMTVVSPDTKQVNTGCLGSNLALPADGVIYVQDMPASTTDPNYSATCAVNPSWDGDTCTKGDVFIQGNTSGQLTVAASNNVIITGNLTYPNINATNPRPVLGLIANNEIEVNHPVSTSCSGLPVSGSYCNTTGTVTFSGTTTFNVPVYNPTIDAAMLSLNHSFAVMNFNEGPSSWSSSYGLPATSLGSVNLIGAVAGNFMDIEGVFAGNGSLQNGYGVNYAYDQRFANGGLVPPDYLDPTSSYWHRVSYAEVTNPTS